MRQDKIRNSVGLGLGIATLLGTSLAAGQAPPGASSAAPSGVAEPAPQAAMAPPTGTATAPVPTSPPTEQANTQPPPPPTIDLRRDAPLPRPVARTDHTHDGFYARLSLGFGHLGSTMNPPNSNGITGKGATLALDLALGYAVNPGIVLGGMILAESLPAARLDADVPVITDVTAWLLGPFFDGYPKARGGFHLGGGLGLAGTRVNPKSAAGFTNARGYGISGWLGYDVWVADQWSAGILLRLMGTRTKADAVQSANGDAGNATMATQSIAIMLTGVYN